MQHGERDVYENGYRLNVCIVLCNEANQVLIARRVDGRNWWQFPQGGIQRGESALQAMYRELREEVGLKPHQVKVVARSPQWFRYRTGEIRRRAGGPVVGQKQRWFLLRFASLDHAIDLDRANPDAEFNHWVWVDYWEPLQRIVRFKRRVYRDALESLLPAYRALESA